MRALAVVALLATISGGCQTKRQCVVGIVGGGALFVGGAMLAYDTRHEDEGTVAPLGALVLGGVVAVFSVINLIALVNEKD